MKKTKPPNIITTAIVLLFAAILVTQPFMVSMVFAVEPNEPHSADAMWIEPSTIELSTETIPDVYKFNITVWINLTVASSSWEFKLAYNKNHLNATRCGYTNGTRSEFFKDINTMALEPSFSSINTTHSYVLHGEVAFMAQRAPGYGSLAWVEFEVKARPPEGETYTSLLDIASYYPDETYAQDPAQQKIPLNAINGNYRISTPGGPPPPPTGAIIYVDPPSITDPTMEPSSTFIINITVANVSDMKTCEFNLTYNPNVIGCLGINFFKVQGQAPTSLMALDDEAGFLWVKLSYKTAVTTESSPLVAVTFHMESYGVSVLDLHDTVLTDSNGEPIPHEAIDGLFLTLIRDVATIDVYPFRNWTYIGLKINITVLVKNLGDQNETFTVTAYYDSFGIGDTVVEDLQPDEERAVIFIWDTNDTTACHNYTISAKASIVPYDLNTTNNEFIDGQVKIRILGDVNGDGRVRTDDIFIAAQAFGSVPGHPRWVPEADLNDDNKVRVDDVYIVASNFGKSCPE